ncbi:MAG TPA: Amuc_1100 family pilus-like protein [Verrucomicrobiales bacterium]|nr:Amuc_1100 family pilus-like protein [Verrucomicrobiales bacterium]
MSQGKQNKFIVIYFSVLGAGALVLGYLGWSASSSSDEAEQNYKNAAAELDRLEKAPLSRTDENAKEKTKLVEAFVNKVKELNTTLTGYQAKINTSETNESFQRKLNEATKAVKDNAAAHGVKLDAKFDLGMGNYLGEFPVSGSAPRLSAQLDGIVFLATTAFDAGVTSIDSLTREKLPFESEKSEPAPGTATPANRRPPATRPAPAAAKSKAPVGPVVPESDVMERQPVAITVTGKNRAILNFLEMLANPSPDKAPHFYAIRTIRVENSQKDGPPKSVVVEEKEVQPDPNDKSSVFRQDAIFLLGNEDVRMHLDLDLIRFSDLPAETEKTAPAKGSAKPVANTAKPPVKAPAPSATPPAPAETPAPSAPAPATPPAPSSTAAPATPPAAPAPGSNSQ